MVDSELLKNFLSIPLTDEQKLQLYTHAYNTALDSVEEKFRKEMLLHALQVEKEIKEILTDHKSKMTKTYTGKLKHIQKVLMNYYDEFAQQTNRAIEDTATVAYNASMHEIFQDMTSPKKPSNDLYKAWTEITKTYMKKTADEFYTGLQKEILFAQGTGEDTYMLMDRLSIKYGDKITRHTEFFVQDTIGKVQRTVANNSYKEHTERIEAYFWYGPQDSHTTEYCTNRKRFIWYPEDLEKYKNNFRRDGYYIYDPKNGSFDHPHYRCRHKMYVIPKKRYRPLTVKLYGKGSITFMPTNSSTTNIIEE